MCGCVCVRVGVCGCVCVSDEHPVLGRVIHGNGEVHGDGEYRELCVAAGMWVGVYVCVLCVKEGNGDGKEWARECVRQGGRCVCACASP